MVSEAGVDRLEGVRYSAGTMKPSYGIFVAILALGVGRVDAQPTRVPVLPLVPPPPESMPQPLPAPKPLNGPGVARTGVPAGRFALVKDQRLIEGEVFLAQDNITIRRGAIETAVPKIDVLFIGNSREEVYEYQRKFVGPEDVEGRLKLAKWCAFSGLREYALAEARAVTLLDPMNSAAVQMVKLLEESLRKYPLPGSKSAPATIPPSTVRPVPLEPFAAGLTPAPVVPAIVTPAPVIALPAKTTPPATVVSLPARATPSTTVIALPAIASPPVTTPLESDVPAGIAMAFRSRVQPVLTNLCVSCHARPEAIGFKLARMPEWDTNEVMVRQNMKAVLAHVRNENPASSPFLVIALARHGGMREPAFSSDRAPGYRALVDWVQIASPFVPVAKKAEASPLPNGPVSLLPLMPKRVDRSTPAKAPDIVPLPPVSRPLLPTVSSPLPPVMPRRPTPEPSKLPSVPPPPGVSKDTVKDIVVPVVGQSKPVESSVLAASAKSPPRNHAFPIVGMTFAAEKEAEKPKGPNPMNSGAPVDEFDPSLFNRAAHPQKK